jgi:hypothetical protein
MAGMSRARWPMAAVAVLLTAAGCARSGPELAGQWQLAWQGRIGTEHATVVLQARGQVLNGSFRTAQTSVPLSGSVHGRELSFEVALTGPPPYRVRFSGTAQGDRIDGQALPQDVDGRAFAGHGGEVSQHYYTWTAVRVAP